jgi:hypothetical protein
VVRSGALDTVIAMAFGWFYGTRTTR